MQRTLLIVLATAVVAAGIAAGATIMLTGDDELAINSPLPTFTPVATLDVTSPTPEPSATDQADETEEPDDTDEPGSTDEPAATDGVKIRSAASVDCDDEPEFCSGTDSVVVDDGEQSDFKEAVDPGSNTRPTISMQSDVTEKSGKVDRIEAEVVVENKTDDTFRFAKREVVLDIFRNGKLWKRLDTDGAGFDLTPGGKMTGSFEQPVTDDGTYSWEAKVWYYKK
jgi:hypothetical protein